jgi:glycosyltransferase involved in cell wall biosynthesis
LLEEGVTGMLFDPHDTKALKEGLRRMVQSPGAAQAMGRRCRERVEADFDVESIARQYLNLYLS